MTKQNELEAKSVEKLFEMIDKDYMVGPTHFKEKEKAYMACSYYQSLFDYEKQLKVDLNKIIPGELRKEVYYGPSLKSVLVQIILNME